MEDGNQEAEYLRKHENDDDYDKDDNRFAAAPRVIQALRDGLHGILHILMGIMWMWMKRAQRVQKVVHFSSVGSMSQSRSFVYPMAIPQISLSSG